MQRISSLLSRLITSKHWHMPKCDTPTLPELHVTPMQGSKTEYFNVYQPTNVSNNFRVQIKNVYDEYLPCVVVAVRSSIVATVGP